MRRPKLGTFAFAVFSTLIILLYFPNMTGTVISQIFIIVAKNNSKCPVLAAEWPNKISSRLFVAQIGEFVNIFKEKSTKFATTMFTTKNVNEPGKTRNIQARSYDITRKC